MEKPVVSLVQRNDSTRNAFLVDDYLAAESSNTHTAAYAKLAVSLFMDQRDMLCDIMLKWTREYWHFLRKTTQEALDMWRHNLEFQYGMWKFLGQNEKHPFHETPVQGTTWTQELVWMVGNNCDYKTSAAIPLVQRFPFLEYAMFIDNDRAREIIQEACGDVEEGKKIAKKLSRPGTEIAADLPSPRYLKTHSAFSMLPPDILDKSKVVYVARDPRDIAVSYHHHHAIMPAMGYVGDFKSFWELFKKGMVDWAPYFDHVKEAWARKDHPNLLFLFYEELSKDLPAVIRRVAKFLGKTVTKEQMGGLCEHLNFENFKKNKSVNLEEFKKFGVIKMDKHFMRKGKTGDWRTHFDEEMAKEAEQWITDNLRGTDIKFPH